MIIIATFFWWVSWAFHSGFFGAKQSILSRHTQRRIQSIQCFGSTDIKSYWWRHSTQSILTKTTVGELSMFKSPKSSKFLQTSYWINSWHKLHYIDLEELLYLEKSEIIKSHSKKFGLQCFLLASYVPCSQWSLLSLRGSNLFKNINSDDWGRDESKNCWRTVWQKVKKVGDVWYFHAHIVHCLKLFSVWVWLL